MNFYLSSEYLNQVTAGIPALNERVLVGMGEGIAGADFANNPRGYWGATVVACDAETEEWVLRFDVLQLCMNFHNIEIATYGEIWDAG